MMAFVSRTMVFSVLAFACAAPAAAQDAATPVPATTPDVVTPAPASAPGSATPATPAMTPEQYLGVPEFMLHLDLSTGGRVTIQLYPHLAPGHVERIKGLTRAGFYDGLKFHRVIDGFMAQTGDPTATGTGASQLPDLTAEFNAIPHLRGTLSMARSQEPNSANSQFFIMFQPRFSLDRNYTALGRVVSGMQYVDAIQRGEPPEVMSRMVQVSVAADNKPMPPASALAEAAAPVPSLAELSAPAN